MSVMADQKPSVLLVDDEGDILFSLKALLRREFDLFTADSGEEALRILSERPIRVVMSDQRMPGMTGVELLSQVKSLYPHTIRILFTGYADIKAVVDGINRGGLFRYLTKPWDPDDLLEVLRSAAEMYERRAEQAQLLHELRLLLAESAPNDIANSDDVWRNRVGNLMARLDRLLEVESTDQAMPRN
jgi:response regulator RpfG family c-di-GMP phosphodiesterase